MGTINVNCVHFKHPCRCTCEDADVPGTWLSWLLGKSCVLLDRCVSVCLHQRMHPRPEPPKASVPPPQIAGGQRPTVHLFAAMDPPPTKPWTMTATCPKCQHQFVIGEMKPMKCGVPIPEESMPSGGEAPMVKAGETILEVKP